MDTQAESGSMHRTDRSLSRLIRRMFIYATIAVLVHHTALWSVQRKLLFPGSMMDLGGAPQHPGLVRLQVEHEEGMTFGFLKLAPTESRTAPAPLIVYAHGNAEVVADWVFEIQPYTEQGFHFLAVEYRGFGTSAGAPSQAGIHADIQALIRLAVEREDVDGSQIVYHGRSLGGAVLGSLAGLTRPAGLILESAFSSTHSMAKRYLAPRYLIRDPLDVEASLATDFQGPVLLLHSRVDEVIPFGQFELNRGAALSRGEDTIVETLTHDALDHNSTWLSHVPAKLAAFAGECVEE